MCVSHPGARSDGPRARERGGRGGGLWRLWDLLLSVLLCEIALLVLVVAKNAPGVGCVLEVATYVLDVSAELGLVHGRRYRLRKRRTQVHRDLNGSAHDQAAIPASCSGRSNLPHRGCARMAMVLHLEHCSPLLALSACVIKVDETALDNTGLDICLSMSESHT